MKLLGSRLVFHKRTKLCNGSLQLPPDCWVSTHDCQGQIGGHQGTALAPLVLLGCAVDRGERGGRPGFKLFAALPEGGKSLLACVNSGSHKVP